MEVGATVRYIKNDHVEKGVLVGVNITDQSNPPFFTIEFHDGRRVETTREHVEMLDTPDLFEIPVKAKSIIDIASAIPEDLLEKMMNPESLTPLQQLWIWWHEKMDHLPRADMNELVDQGLLPSKFKKLKDWVFICASCLFGKQPKKSWRSRGQPSNIKKNVKDPGDKVCIDLSFPDSNPGPFF